MVAELKKARNEANLTIDEVARALNIKKQYLIALEEGNFEVLPGKVYVKGYLKLYTKYLGINLALHDLGENTTANLKRISATDLKLQKYLIIVSISMLLIINIVYHLLY